MNLTPPPPLAMRMEGGGGGLKVGNLLAFFKRKYRVEQDVVGVVGGVKRENYFH